MRLSPFILAAVTVSLLGCSVREEPILVLAVQDPAQGMYDKIDAIVLPVPDKSKATDEEYEDTFMAEFKSVVVHRGGLIFELCKQYPNGDRTAPLFDAHWNSVMKTNIEDGDLEKYIGQIKDVVGEDSPKALDRQGKYWIAFLSSFRDKEDSEAILSHAEKFSSKYPTDQRGVTLFNFATVAQGASVQTMTSALRAIVEKYPASRQVTRAKALLPLLPHVGETFELDVDDSINGKKVTIEGLRGKVVIIDFWATWCQPCIEAIPDMKRIYAEYKDKGVEFVGISLDVPIAQGGLDDLQRFVKAYEIDWPQYYAGEDPQLIAKYSVSSLPAMFILDKKGVIRSVDGHSVLTRTIDELLEE